MNEEQRQQLMVRLLVVVLSLQWQPLPMLPSTQQLADHMRAVLCAPGTAVGCVRPGEGLMMGSTGSRGMGSSLSSEEQAYIGSFNRTNMGYDLH